MDYLDHVSLGKGHGYYNFLVTDTRQNGTSLCFKSDASATTKPLFILSQLLTSQWNYVLQC